MVNKNNMVAIGRHYNRYKPGTAGYNRFKQEQLIRRQEEVDSIKRKIDFLNNKLKKIPPLSSTVKSIFNKIGGKF